MSAFTLVYTRAYTVNIYSDTVDIPFPNLVKSGTTTSVASFQLIDISANFSGIQVGDTIVDVSNGMAYVTGIINSTTLLISEDIFTGAGQNYQIYQGQNYGCYLYIPSGLDYSINQVLEVETIGGDTLRFHNPPAGVLPVQVRKITTSTNFFKIVALW